MEITQEHKTPIEQIISRMECPKDFACYKSGFENLGDVGIVGDAIMVECLEEKAKTCTFGFPFGLGYLCNCPLRNYIAKNLHI